MNDSEMKVTNAEIARLLETIADLLEFNDENVFKVRSYRTAATAVTDHPEPIAEAAARGGAVELQKLPGIGKGISAQILQIASGHKSEYLEELSRKTPVSALELRRVTGVGLKTAQTLFRDFGIKSLGELDAFAKGGGLASVPGLGEKKIATIQRSIGRLVDNARRREEVEAAGDGT